jgi:hypothetical protein
MTCIDGYAMAKRGRAGAPWASRRFTLGLFGVAAFLLLLAALALSRSKPTGAPGSPRRRAVEAEA